jgi:hypothetical protein
MTPNAVDYEMDVYKATMCHPSNGGADAFFRLEHSSTTASIPRDKVRLSRQGAPLFPFLLQC